MSNVCRFCQDGRCWDCLDGTTDENTLRVVECDCALSHSGVFKPDADEKTFGE